MAFISKVGNLLKQTVSRHGNSQLSASNPSIFQAIRSMSSSKVFVGGLSYNTDDQSLREAFAAYGEVIEARVIMDRETGRSRGFGFVSYTSTDEASGAIQALDGQDLHGRRVKVNYATDRTGGGGGYGGGGGGYGGGGYGGGGGGYGGGGGSYGGGGYGGGGGGGGGSYGGSVDSGYGGAGNYGSSGGSYGGSGDSGYGGTGNVGGYGATGGGGGGYGGGSSSFEGGNVTGYGGGASGGSYGVASGGGGSDNFVSGAPAVGVDGSYATGSFGGSTGVGFGGDQFGSNQVNNTGAPKGHGQDDPVGNYMDDNDEPDAYANKSG